MLRGIAMCIYVIEDAICPISSNKIVCEGACIEGEEVGKVKAETEAIESMKSRQRCLNSFKLVRFT